MKCIHAALLAASLLAAGGAVAQDKLDNGELLRQNSEMMRPSILQYRENTEGEQAAVAPMSEDDRRAEEFRKSVEMMKPQGISQPATTARQPVMTALSEDDRRMQEFMQRTDRMMPQ